MSNNSSFNIFASVKSAYLFVAREKNYLLQISLLPIGAQIACLLFVQFQRPHASQIETYLWSLPAEGLFGWYLFLQTRLLLLGEKQAPPPAGTPAYARRRRNMEASIIAFVLFNMAFIAATDAWLTRQEHLQDKGQADSTSIMIQLLIVGAIFWGARFGIVPILAAVGHPIGAVLKKTWGAMFSLRLIGLLFLSVLPVTLLSNIILIAILPHALLPDGSIHLTTQQQTFLSVIDAPISLLSWTLMSASMAYALKQILGKGRRDRIV